MGKIVYVDSSDKRSSNILKYYLWQLISGFSFVYALQAIYLLSKGFRAGDLAIFASVTAITATIMEIPTGYIADKFSRKLSISLGFFIKGISFILLIFSNNLLTLAIVGLVLGLGDALLSGSVESLLYDMLKITKDERSYLKVSSKGTAMATITGALATFIGPLIFIANRELPFILTGMVLLVLSIFVLTIEEHRFESEEVKRNLSVFDGIKNIFRNKVVLIITLIDTILLVVVNLFYQVLNFPKLENLGFPVKFLGLLDVVNLVLMTMMLLFVSKLVLKKEKNTIFIYSIITMIAFISFYLTSNLFLAIFFGVMFDIIWSARKQIIPSITNDYFSSKDRATSISSMSFLSNLGASIFVPIALKLFEMNELFVFLPLFLIVSLSFVYPKKPNLY